MQMQMVVVASSDGARELEMRGDYCAGYCCEYEAMLK
jgi:hypothetical protein